MVIDMGCVSVITSGKGGAGKSTVTAGLGCALAKLGRKVLLVDADAGLRSLDLMMGIGGSVIFSTKRGSEKCDGSENQYFTSAVIGAVILSILA